MYSHLWNFILCIYFFMSQICHRYSIAFTYFVSTYLIWFHRNFTFWLIFNQCVSSLWFFSLYKGTNYSYILQAVCKKILDPSLQGKKLLKALFEAISIYFNGTKTEKCLNIEQYATAQLGDLGWDFQVDTFPLIWN